MVSPAQQFRTAHVLPERAHGRHNGHRHWHGQTPAFRAQERAGNATHATTTERRHGRGTKGMADLLPAVHKHHYGTAPTDSTPIQ